MILLLLFAWLVGWSLGMLLRQTTARTLPTTRAALRQQPGDRFALPRGLEDDPARWPPAPGEWTELDERQLMRLLRESAS